jgi:hypothetical protein
MYQSDFKEPLKSKEYLGIRTTSEILPGKIIHGAGEFDARNYKLVDEYDPHNTGQGISAQTYPFHLRGLITAILVPAQCVITMEIQPSEYSDFDARYRKDHAGALSGMPGYRRSQRYQIGSPVPLLTLSERPPILIVHEFDNLESREIRTNSANEKSQGEDLISIRKWQRLHAEGYENTE